MKRISVILLAIALFLCCCPPIDAQAITGDTEKTKAEIIAEFKSNIQVGSFNTPMIDSEDDVRLMKENGIDFVHLFGWCVRGDYDRALEWCEKYKIYVFLDDISIYMTDEQLIAALRSERSNNPVVIGHHLCDEPLPEQFEKLAHIVEIYTKERPDLIPFINLLPDYATLPCSFEDYISGYLNTVKTGYVSTDIYPLTTTGTRTSYLTSMATIKEECDKTGADIWMYILGVGHSTYRTPTYEDFAYQNYMALAFGVTKIMNFCYATPVDWNVDVSNTALQGSVTADGDKTDIYDITASVNAEIHTAAEVLNKYKNVGAFAVPSAKGRYSAYTGAFAEQSAQYDETSFKYINGSKCLIVGCFDPKDEQSHKDAFILVNGNEILGKIETTAAFAFSEPKTVTAYIKGVKTVLKPDLMTGEYTLELGVGQGVVIETDPVELSQDFTIEDALTAFKHVAGLATADYISRFRYDTDNDNEVTIRDSLIIFKTVAGL